MPTLNWIGKEAVVNHHLHVPFHLLKDVPDLARVLAEKGKPDDARRVYEQIITQYQDNFASQFVGQEPRKLKK